MIDSRWQDEDADDDDWDRELPEPDDEDGDAVDTIECRACHAEVDADLPFCPVCGAEIESPRSGISQVSTVFIVVILIVMLLLGSLWWGL